MKNGNVNYMLPKSGDESQKGVILNLHSRPCSLEGCTGVRMYVKWPDGKHTYPCSKGCTQLAGHLWKIG